MIPAVQKQIILILWNTMFGFLVLSSLTLFEISLSPRWAISALENFSIILRLFCCEFPFKVFVKYIVRNDNFRQSDRFLTAANELDSLKHWFCMKFYEDVLLETYLYWTFVSYGEELHRILLITKEYWSLWHTLP